MLFSHLARIIAWLALIFGLANLALGLSIANELIGPYEEALARYTSADSSGEVINMASYMLLFAIALGTVAEISSHLRKMSNPQQ